MMAIVRMVQNQRIISFLVAVCFISQPGFARYSGGTGEPTDPYQIATAEDLNLLGETPWDYSKHFKLTADIDLSSLRYGRALIAPDNTHSSSYHGTPFSGVFEGNHHTISNLTITGNHYLGLFGQLESDAQIRNLAVMDVNIVSLTGKRIGGVVGYNKYGHIINTTCSGVVQGSEAVGGLVGYNNSHRGRVSNSHCIVSVSGRELVGGLVGENGGYIADSHCRGTVRGTEVVGGLAGANNYGNITNCHSDCRVNGNYRIGGLIGLNSHDVLNSYSVGEVQGVYRVGGLIGQNEEKISQCYSDCAVTGNKSVGGLVGDNGYVGPHETSSVSNSYCTGAVSGDTEVGGLFGRVNRGEIFNNYSIGTVNGKREVGGMIGFGHGPYIDNCFWDIETSGHYASRGGGTGKTTAEMQTAATFLDAGWDFVHVAVNGTDDIWKIVEGRTYPLLAWQKYSGGAGDPNDPYRIASAEDLMQLGECPEDYSNHFRLIADIDLDPNLPRVKVFNRAVIAPVEVLRDRDSFFWGKAFEGVFDGNNHVILNLTIKGKEAVGLFGCLGPKAFVSNLGLVQSSVNGTFIIGSLVGWQAGYVVNCFSTGAVSGEDDMGGLVGRIVDGTLDSSHSASLVDGRSGVGGLAGGIYDGHILSCYNTGSVNVSSTMVGGLVGFGLGGSITSSYSVGSVRGEGTAVGGLLGYNNNCSVLSSFWDTEASGLSRSSGGIGLTTGELQTESTFLNAGWDFVNETINGTEDIWWINEGKDYPRLWWEVGAEN